MSVLGRTLTLAALVRALIFANNWRVYVQRQIFVDETNAVYGNIVFLLTLHVRMSFVIELSFGTIVSLLLFFTVLKNIVFSFPSLSFSFFLCRFFLLFHAGKISPLKKTKPRNSLLYRVYPTWTQLHPAPRIKE